MVNLLGLEIVFYEAIYLSNVGFNINFEKFNLFTQSLLKNGIRTLIKENTPKELGYYRPLYLKIDFDSINRPLRWTRDNHKCFEKPFQLVVKQLLLIAKYVPQLHLNKNVLLEILIPMLANMEQEKYINKRGTRGTSKHKKGEVINWVHQMTFHSNGNISTNGILNVVMIN